MNTRRKGSRFEYLVRDKLKNAGFYVTKSSNSQFPDFCAVKKESGGIPQVMYVECKVGKYLSRKEKEFFGQIRKITGALCFVAYPERHGRKVAVVIKELKVEHGLVTQQVKLSNPDLGSKDEVLDRLGMRAEK